MTMQQSMHERSLHERTMREQPMQEYSMQACIEACTYCHQVCLQTAMNYCLNTGGRHVEAEHFRMMMNCAEICQMSANFQLGNSQFSPQVCAICADVCTACAADCRNIGNMEECVEACEQCAESCRQMASGVHH
jgi:hypothetical protein